MQKSDLLKARALSDQVKNFTGSNKTPQKSTLSPVYFESAKTPMKGVDYFTATEIQAIKNQILSELNLADFLTPEIVKELVKRMQGLPENDRLDVSGLRNASTFIWGNKKYGVAELMHGGAATSTGGGGFTTLSPTETPNGIITVFTFPSATAKPSFIMSDNVIMPAIAQSGTVNWTWNGTTQATLTIAPIDTVLAIV